MELSLLNVLSSFIVLFALIDILGSVPLFLNFTKNEEDISPSRAALYSFLILVGFLFVGEWILKLFSVDVQSFAVAGALVIFIISIEMIFGIEVFKNDSPSGGKRSATLVPIVFPLIAGPGTFTALLSMRTEFSIPEIVVSILLNMVIVFFVLRYLDKVRNLIGVGGVYMLRKFFGIILMAIAVKLFTSNISALLNNIN